MRVWVTTHFRGPHRKVDGSGLQSGRIVTGTGDSAGLAAGAGRTPAPSGGAEYGGQAAAAGVPREVDGLRCFGCRQVACPRLAGTLALFIEETDDVDANGFYNGPNRRSLLAHPIVSECCVLCLPNKDLGEVVCAIVLLDLEVKKKEEVELFLLAADGRAS
ncbi:acyl-coenzyme A synthetase ACSM1 [Striga asiatica]|uniref:Acyl-coenzyme A synthetase ACSM1 n=1 Tax=Striga asiatica TaxID=4170 RepID=A0A5A7NXG5_STRAF|nr:acyl-coenzyme A synthetase ACSM1 [Striga asiatica]